MGYLSRIYENRGDLDYVAIKLKVKNASRVSKRVSLARNSGTKVHFSDKHDNYLNACRFMSKSCQHVFFSLPNLQEIGFLRTGKCVQDIQHKTRDLEKFEIQKVSQL